MTSPATQPPSTAPTVTCPSCQTQAPQGSRFCPNCGASLGGTNCLSCGAALAPGAKFCHRCGTAVGTGSPPGEQRSFTAALPWGVAAVALVALVALVAGQRFEAGRGANEGGSPTQESAGAAPFAGGEPTGGRQAPDISNLTPAEAAVRLYNRVMSAHERGRADTVQLFAPMAIMAYERLDSLDLDQRYDLGRIAAVAGDEQLARSEADTILAKYPNHLLGLILAGNAARMRKDTAAIRRYHDKLEAAAPAERARQLPEYITHENDITIALDAKRP